jgi:hypothetical protein
LAISKLAAYFYEYLTNRQDFVLNQISLQVWPLSQVPAGQLSAATRANTARAATNNKATFIVGD